MRVSTIYISAATIVLGVAAFIVTKANVKKFAGFSTAVNTSGTVKVIGTNIFTTVAAHGSQAYIVTSGGTQEWYLVTKVNLVKIAYLK